MKLKCIDYRNEVINRKFFAFSFLLSMLNNFLHEYPSILFIFCLLLTITITFFFGCPSNPINAFTRTQYFFIYKYCVISGPYLLSTLFNRLYCYAQKHVRSIRAVTKDPCEITEKRYRSIRRINNKPNKKLKMRNLNHSSPYHVSDHKAAITVGVIMGVFLGKFKIIMFSL